MKRYTAKGMNALYIEICIVASPINLTKHMVIKMQLRCTVC
jgi:hypothetical protein